MNKRKIGIPDYTKCKHKPTPTPLPHYHCNKFRLKQTTGCDEFDKVKRKRK